MSKKKIPNARERILKGAVTVFARKGFEGSRVDEVAKEAGVPKSLIYYHFKSKDEILKVLLSTLLEDYRALIKLSPDDTHAGKFDEMESKEARYKEFMIKNADLLRIVFIESLKKTNRKPALYKVVEILIEAEEAESGIARQPGYDRDERLVAEFFTNIIPQLAYLCFRDSWIEQFEIEGERLDGLFRQVYKETHGAYHKSHE